MQSPSLPHKKGNRGGSESNQLIGYGFILIETKQFICINMWSTYSVSCINCKKDIMTNEAFRCKLFVWKNMKHIRVWEKETAY